MPDEPYSLQRLRGQLAIVWHEDGRRHRHSLGTSDRTSAEAAARAFWKRRARRGDLGTVGEVVAAYLEDRKNMLSIKRAETAWKAAKAFWNALPIGRVDQQAAEDYGKHRSHCKPITVRNELAVIRAALNWAKKEKLISEAPFVKMPQFTTRKIRHLSKPQFRKLVAAAHAPHVALFMKLAVATGARSTALLELTWDRVDFAGGTIDMNAENRVQTSKYRAIVSMNDQIRASLADAKAGAMSDFVIEYGSRQVLSVKKGFEAAAVRAGLKVTPHMLRHSAAVWMAEGGVAMAVIAQFLGHSDSRITERVYARFSPEFLSRAAESLTW